MGVDRFICGACETEFHDFNVFLQHKSEGCQVQVPVHSIEAVSVEDGTTGQVEVVQVVAELVEMKVEEQHEQQIYEEQEQEEHQTVTSDIQLVPLEVEALTEQTNDSHAVASGSEYEVLAKGPEPEPILPGTVQIIPAGTVQTIPAGTVQTIPAGTVLVNDFLEPAAAVSPIKQPVRKRGRPRKGEEKAVKVVPKEKEEPRPPLPERSKDGRYPCPRCKKSFMKERHFNTHKCLADSDYVDITKKEALGSDEEVSEEEEEEKYHPDLDRSVEYRMPTQVGTGRKRGRPRTIKSEAPVVLVPSGPATLGSGPGQVTGDQPGSQALQELGQDSGLLGPQPEPPDGETVPIGEQQSIPGMNPLSSDPKLPMLMDSGSEVIMDGSLSLTSLITARQQVPDIPVFQDEEEKMAFEESLNVDLTQVDNMFKTHVIEQDVNESGPLPVIRSSSELTIFSCNVCHKVFKTASHMRLHCLTHTDLKPFKCPKCSYASNSKGNLYTHMRKHTGQFYRCSHCDFKSVNKSHLVEHEAIHSKIRVKCQLCHKDYNTVKSLINHIRKYHNNTRSGREYLEKFQGKNQTGSAVLHQCHVCNRKFKKKLDRDRHLFVHNIKDNAHVHPCELCPYTASRRIYLEKHFHKHRVIYVCSVCCEKFPSTIRLNNHLNEAHHGGQSEAVWGELFQTSIEASLFLPEPDGSLADLGTPYGSTKDNLQTASKEAAPEQLPDAQLRESGPELNGETSASFTENESVKDSAKDTAEHDGSPIDNQANHDNPEERVNESQVDFEKTTSSVALEGDASNDSVKFPLKTIRDIETQNVENSAFGGSRNDSEAPTSVETGVEQLEEGGDLPELPGEGTELTNDDLSTSVEGQTNTMDADAVDQLDDLNSGDEDAANSAEAVALEQKEDYDIYKRLHFMKMSMDVFHKLRQNFGNEECEFCGRLFYSRIDFEPHVRTHTGDRPFSCDQCDYRAITKDNLKRHIEKEHEKLKYVCNECDFVANSRTQLWHHQQKHKLPQKVSCPKCNIEFTSLKRFRVHLSVKHPTMNADEVKKLTGVYHKAQGKLGRRSYKCPYCEKTFMRASSDLQKHIWIHEGIKPFKCPLCPHACRSKNNLMAHMLRHSQEKPFLCMDCGKAYKSKTALRWHVRTHKDGKIFKCTKCPYEAVQKSHLKRHMETHEVVKRYVCQHCDYSANTLGYMKIHYTRQHKGAQYTYNPVTLKTMQPDTKVYRCLSCDYLFGNLSDMKRHLKVRHHVQVEDIQALENLDTQPDTQILPAVAADQHIPQSEVQVVQVAEPDMTSTEEADATSALQALQYSVPSGDLDEKTASAVNILQQIIGMSQQGAYQQQITVQSEDGQMVAVNPDTIIVQEDGEEVVVASGNHGDDQPSEYVIQYVTNDSMELAQTDVSDEIVTEGVDMATIEEMEASVSRAEAMSADPEVIATTTDIMARSVEAAALPTNESQAVIMDANQALNVQTIEIQGGGHAVIGPDGVLVPEYVTLDLQGGGLQEGGVVTEMGVDDQVHPGMHQYTLPDSEQTVISLQSNVVS